jgi:cell division protein FtsI (penicillin-binding protein 3)
VAEDDSHEQTGDIGALYAAANDLPSDDPQRASAPQTPPPSVPATSSQSQTNAQPASTNANPTTTQQQQTATTVTIADGKSLRVPSLIGLPVRRVIEQAAAAGLEVEINGNGTVREQAPAPGTMVAPGTRIIVRCGR